MLDWQDLNAKCFSYHKTWMFEHGDALLNRSSNS